jgi:hypothetical protein
MICNNSTIKGQPIVQPGCWGNAATVKATIAYGGGEKEVLNLCNDCIKDVKRDVKKYGYKITTRRI